MKETWFQTIDFDNRQNILTPNNRF
ncbi:hypothetical protein EMIT0P291_30248 [Pseudomonas sp. IT-P291]